MRCVWLSAGNGDATETFKVGMSNKASPAEISNLLRTQAGADLNRHF